MPSWRDVIQLNLDINGIFRNNFKASHPATQLGYASHLLFTSPIEVEIDLV